MNHEEIVKEVKMTYYELQDYLLKKYGPAKYDYFTKPECKYKNKNVSRTKEGLYCHHMDEDEGGNLSNPPQAKLQCFEWQKKRKTCILQCYRKSDITYENQHSETKENVDNTYGYFKLFYNGWSFLDYSDIG